MEKQEIMDTTIGEMADMISCLAIYEGHAVPKKEKTTDFDEAIKMR